MWIEQALDMNEFEMQNFKIQSKFSQMIFEDFMMLLMDLLIVIGVFSVPDVFDKNFEGNALFA